MINLDQVGPKSLVKTVLMYGTRPMLQAMDSMYQDDGSCRSDELSLLGMVKDSYHLIDGLRGSILKNAILNFT